MALCGLFNTVLQRPETVCGLPIFRGMITYFHSFIGDQNEAQRGIVACPRSWALKVAELRYRPNAGLLTTWATMQLKNRGRAGAVLSACNFRWVPGLAITVCQPLSRAGPDYCLSTIVKSWTWLLHTLVLLTYLPSFFLLIQCPRHPWLIFYQNAFELSLPGKNKHWVLKKLLKA